MTPEQFEKAGRQLFGDKWKPAMAKALHMDRTMVWRYVTGQQPIPELVADFIRCLQRERRGRKHTKKS
jgi:hypothetical protein